MRGARGAAERHQPPRRAGRPGPSLLRLLRRAPSAPDSDEKIAATATHSPRATRHGRARGVGARSPWCAASACRASTDEPPSACWLKRQRAARRPRARADRGLHPVQGGGARARRRRRRGRRSSRDLQGFQANLDVAGADLVNGARATRRPSCAAACIERGDCAAAALTPPGATRRRPAAQDELGGHGPQGRLSLCVGAAADVHGPSTTRPPRLRGGAAGAPREDQGAIKHAWDGYRAAVLERDPARRDPPRGPAASTWP